MVLIGHQVNGRNQKLPFKMGVTFTSIYMVQNCLDIVCNIGSKSVGTEL